MRLHRFAVLATVSGGGAPQSALINIATDNALQIVFDTLDTTRKHANLLRDPRAAVTFSGPDEQTLQFEGVAIPVSPTDNVDYEIIESYFEVWPDRRKRGALPGIVYWRIKPRWARFSDYARGPLVAEFNWNAD
jgi:pyridoxine/pyridoxamine 5'-phosphate oxidase